MPPVDINKITLDTIELPILKERGIKLSVLRLDKIHPDISGNKWFKLKYHLEEFRKTGYKGIVTFGGAWSNHILATAGICAMEGISCIGIIRGERPAQFSQTLNRAASSGMQLEFMPRNLYRERNNSGFIPLIKNKYSGYYVIPEGGAGELGEKGIREIYMLKDLTEFSHIVCAMGTGTMFNGLVSANQENKVIGIPVLKGYSINPVQNSDILPDFHFGGYAKYTNKLIAFMNEFFESTAIPTDFVYTAKMMYGVIDSIKKGYFKPETKICCIHSGGLQGNNSMPKGTLIF